MKRVEYVEEEKIEISLDGWYMLLSQNGENQINAYPAHHDLKTEPIHLCGVYRSKKYIGGISY